MTSTSEILKSVIGEPVSEKITFGTYGNTIYTSNGYALGDPCYYLSDAVYSEFRSVAFAQEPMAYHGILTNWMEIDFRGTRAFFKSCSDGVGPFGCCVDSGWVAAILQSEVGKTQEKAI